MEIRIKSIHFDATEKLQEFINKKVEKLQKSYEDIQKVEVQLKVEKPAAALNKTTSLTVTAPGNTLFVEKTCGSVSGRNEGSTHQVQGKTKKSIKKFL